MKRTLLLLFCLSFVFGQGLLAQTDQALMEKILSRIEDHRHDFDILDKKIEDVLWYEKVGDVAFIDKVRLTGPPPANPQTTGNEFQDNLLGNDLKFQSYIFIPRNVEEGHKYPMIVYVHGGIHGTITSTYSHVIRELVGQGYIVVAPDYRGSIGYGKSFYRDIDYGGLENEDVLAATLYMVENYSIVDGDRVGLLGWSHGGMITLMNLTRYPEHYACGYAGVPVSDVAYRLSYKRPSYTDNFTATYHIGKTPQEAPEEYARRSPVSYAKYLEKPLMITTAENDDDVGVLEVTRMIDSLKHYGKEFEYKIYPPMPGAHVFDRIDTKKATDIRFLAYKFLEKYLRPERPFETPADMRKAGYLFN